MKKINIKGKNYIMVNERLKAFRENFKGYSLLTEIVEMTDNTCTMKASILNDKREVVATGFAREVVGKTPINKFAFVENCVPLDTKILTKEGWKFYYQLKEGEEVLSFNMETKRIEFCKLLKINYYENQPLVNLKTSRFNATCTPAHKWIVRTQYKKEPFKVETKDLKSNYQILQNYPQEYQESVLGRKLGWLMCDCELKRNSKGLIMYAAINQSKNIEDIEELFGPGEKTHKYNENWKDNYSWTIKAKEVREILGYFNIDTYKDLSKALLIANINDVAGCFKSMMLADGSRTGRHFYSTYLELVEAVQIACIRLGFSTSFITSRKMKNSTRPLYTLSIKKTLGAYASELKVINIPPHNVWCPTTENGTWFMKQGSFVSLTSNCETSAWGRALGNLGIGIDEDICTAEELNFKLEQEKESTQPAPKQTAEDKAGALLEMGLKLGKAETEAELIKVCKELKAKYPSQKAELVKRYNARLEELKDLEMEKGA